MREGHPEKPPGEAARTQHYGSAGTVFNIERVIFQWDDEFGRNPEWKLQKVVVDPSVVGGPLRRGLNVLAAAGVALKGDLLRPDHPDASPWLPENVEGVIDKA